MKTMRIFILSASWWILAAANAHADFSLQISPAGGNVRLVFDTQSGTNYQVQISTNLSSWDDQGAAVAGDGLSRTQEVSTADHPMAFFRVLATQTSGGTAPSEAEFTALVVGQTVLGYTFVSSTRFSWFGETGNWSYTKTGSNTGKLVFTYDADGNDPAVYREEVVLTFDTPTTGTYVYSEFNFDIEDPGSISSGPFNLAGT